MSRTSLLYLPLFSLTALPLSATSPIVGARLLQDFPTSACRREMISDAPIYTGDKKKKDDKKKTLQQPLHTTVRSQQFVLKDSMLAWRTQLLERIAESRDDRGWMNSAIGAMSGQIAGVNVGNGGADRLAMLTSVRVRGNTSIMGGNDPLVIIDGISSDLSTLSTIYPADIDKFEVLKNASETAQYGSRGAAGVIIVTTKKGREGKFQISYDGSWGWEQTYKNMSMLSAQEYVQTARQLGRAFFDGGENVDYTALPTRVGSVNNHHVAFSGGSATSNYRASIAYTGRETVVQGIGYKNYVAKLDLTQLAFDNHLTIDFGIFGSSQNSRSIPDPQALFYGAATQNPTLSKEWNGNGWAVNPTANQIAAPQARLRIKDEVFNQNLNSHLSLDFKVIPELSLRVFGAYTFTSTENAQFFPTWTAAQGKARRKEEKHRDWLINAALNFEKVWQSHLLKAQLLGEYQEDGLSSFETTVRGFNYNEVEYENLSFAALRPYGGTMSYHEAPRLASLLLNLRYSWLNRYTIAVSSRYDGSSLVGRDNTWGLFPSVSGEWNVKSEPFLQSFTPLSQLTVRGGYGVTGNLGGIRAYRTFQRLEPLGIVPYNNTPTVALGVSHNANPDLSWEKRSTYNIGVAMGWWQNRLLFTAEYYRSHIYNMLYQYDVPVPPFVYDKLLANNGSMRNEGWEIGLGATPIKSRDWELNINVNLTWSRNKLLSLDGDYRGYALTAPTITSIGGLNGAGFHGGNNNVLYQIVGYPLGVFYLPHATGLVSDAQGHRHYAIADLDGDGTVNLSDGGDRYVAGQATPKIMLGSNIALRYKNFDLALQVNGAFGHKIFNGTALSYMNMASFPDYNVMKAAPKEMIQDQVATDYWLERGDYVNIDYITLGWNVPIRNRYVHGLRISVSVNNLATITSYSGLTPMINSNVLNATMGIDDKRSYPVYRTYSAAFSIQF